MWFLVHTINKSTKYKNAAAWPITRTVHNCNFNVTSHILDTPARLKFNKTFKTLKMKYNKFNNFKYNLIKIIYSIWGENPIGKIMNNIKVNTQDMSISPNRLEENKLLK